MQALRLFRGGRPRRRFSRRCVGAVVVVVVVVVAVVVVVVVVVVAVAVAWFFN